MSTWIDRKARRLLLAGALAFAVGAPTVACMGGGTTEEGGGDEGGGGDEAAPKDVQEKALGNWTVQPSKEDMRMLKIFNMALNPKMNVDQFKEKLQPPPTPEEVELFKQVQTLPPDSPEAQFVKMQIKMMKESLLEITESKWILTMGGEKDEWTYSVVSKDDTTLTVKLDSGETNTLTFKSDDKIAVKITDAGGTMELQFARKK